MHANEVKPPNKDLPTAQQNKLDATVMSLNLPLISLARQKWHQVDWRAKLLRFQNGGLYNEKHLLRRLASLEPLKHLPLKSLNKTPCS